jgi:hypothetical protein
MAYSRSDPRYPLADRLCDIVVPATATAGGHGVKAAQFVLFALDRHIGGLDGADLSRVHDSLNSSGHGRFLSLSVARQAKLLALLDSRAYASPAPAPGSGEWHWQRLKHAIIAGYYTSEIGASKELVYEAVPAVERSNFTLTADYRARSNEGFGGDLL